MSLQKEPSAISSFEPALTMRAAKAGTNTPRWGGQKKINLASKDILKKKTKGHGENYPENYSLYKEQEKYSIKCT